MALQAIPCYNGSGGGPAFMVDGGATGPYYCVYLRNSGTTLTTVEIFNQDEQEWEALENAVIPSSWADYIAIAENGAMGGATSVWLGPSIVTSGGDEIGDMITMLVYSGTSGMATGLLGSLDYFISGGNMFSAAHWGAWQATRSRAAAEAVKTRTDVALPAIAPGQPNGLFRSGANTATSIVGGLSITTTEENEDAVYIESAEARAVAISGSTYGVTVSSAGVGLDLNGTNLDTLFDNVLEDTDALHTDWADGGRLDLLLDAAVAGGGEGSTIALVATTVASIDGQTNLVLTAGASTNNAYRGGYAIVRDASNGDDPSIVGIASYNGSTKTLTLTKAASFNVEAGDSIEIFPGHPDTLRGGVSFNWLNQDTDGTGGGQDKIIITQAD